MFFRKKMEEEDGYRWKKIWRCNERVGRKKMRINLIFHLVYGVQ